MVIVPLGKFSFAFLGGKVRFLKGERGELIYWCMLFQTNSLLSFLVFLSFFLSFRSNLFFFSSYSVLSFLCRENLLFSISNTGHGKGLFIVPAVTSVLLFCPLTAFVWSGYACQSYKTPARLRQIHFVHSVRRRLILSFCVPWPFLPRC